MHIYIQHDSCSMPSPIKNNSSIKWTRFLNIKHFKIGTVLFARDITDSNTLKKDAYKFKEAFKVKARFQLLIQQNYSVFLQNYFCNDKHLAYL